MNCYYSNLIEGHDTHPVDIERALHGDYSGDAKKRDLQLEAKAHIGVQQWIDDGALRGAHRTAEAIREIHHRSCEALSADLLWIEDPRRMSDEICRFAALHGSRMPTQVKPKLIHLLDI